MPILKEFDLDLPFANDKSKRMQFRDEIRCVASLYERHFPKLKTDKCWKILVECVTEITKPSVRDLLGVYTVQVLFDADRFFQSKDIEKKSLTLEALKRGIDRVVTDMSWDGKIFDETYEQVVANNYDNRWRWKNPVESPSKKFVAEVLCNHNVSTFEISIVVSLVDGSEINRKVIIEKPNEFAYANHLGILEWISEKEVRLVNKKGDKWWSVSV